MSIRDITLEDTVDFKFSTRAFATGAPTTLAGTPVISAYPGNSVTQLTAGITLTVDFDTVTGLHNIRVVATAANGYANATDYALVITTGTVGGVSVVGEVVAEFTIGRSAAAVDLANGTDGLGAIKGDTAAVLVDTADMQPRVVAIEVDTNELQTDDIPGTLVTIAAYIDTEVAALITTVGVAGAGLTAVPWNASWDAEVQSEVEDALDVTIADSIPADGTRPTVRQALLQITRFLMERSASGTTVTVTKEDGTTASMVFTLDDGSSPTSITRAS